MREPTRRDRILQFSFAALALLLLALAFGENGFAGLYAGAGDSDQWALLSASVRSLAIGSLTAAFALLVGIPAAWLLARRARPIWTLVLCALPLVLPASVTVSGWIALLAPDGFASRLKAPIPGFNPESRPLFSIGGVAFVLATSLWPIIAFELWPAFKRARNESYDAALLSGGPWRAFFRVVLPQAKGELAAGALLVFLLGLCDFTVSSLLLVRTLPIEIHDQLMLGKTSTAAWESLPLVLAVLCVAIGMARWCGRSTSWAAGEPAASTQRGRLSQAVLLCGVGLGFVLPMCACLYAALHGQKALSAVFGAGADAVVVTLRLAGAAALLAAIVALVRLCLWPETRAWPLNAAGLFLLTIPGSFLAAALLVLQQLFQTHTQSLPQTLGAILPVAVLALGYVVRFSYIPLRLVEEGLAALDPELLEAAALSGHGRLSRAVTVALPLVLPHICAAAALVFILSIGEVPIAYKLAPPGVAPAVVWLFQEQHRGYDEAVFGLSLLLGGLSALALLGAGGVAALTGRWLRRGT